MMEIKALPNGAAAGHGAVPKSRPGQREQRFRREESKQLPGKVTWNPESSTPLQVQICASECEQRLAHEHTKRVNKLRMFLNIMHLITVNP